MATQILRLIQVAFVAFTLACSSALWAADNAHDHNSHNDTPGPVQPLKTNPLQQSAKDGPVGPSCNAGYPSDSLTSPVIGLTGEFVWTVTDISLAGRPALDLTRAYRAFDSRDGLFGKGWSTHCEKALVPVIDYESSATPSRAFIYRLDNGQRFKYVETASNQYQSPDGLKGTSLVVNSDETASIRSISGAQETYNRIGQLISESDRYGNSINYTYQNGSLVSISDTNGRSLNFTIDSTGHVTLVTDHTGRQWSYSYNADGTLATVTDPLGGQMIYTYVDVQREASAVIYPVISSITDESGVVQVSVSYDEVGRVASYTEGENEYSYSRSRGILYKTDAMNSEWSFTLDELGRKTKIVYPNRYSEEFEYNDNSDVIKFTDQDGTEFSWTYDDLGRMTSATTPDGSTNYTYRDNTNWITSVVSPTGRTVTMDYDANGNPLTVTDPANFTTRFGWSDQGDLLTITDALNGIITQTFSSIGLVTSITDQLDRQTRFAYDSRGNLTQLTNTLGNASVMSYDLLDRMVSSSDALGHVTAYSLDPVGRLLSLTDANGGITQFDYDIYGRQTLETRADNSVISSAYRADNLLETRTDPRDIPMTYTYNGAKEMTRVAAGVSESASMSYDRLNRITRASYNGSLDYRYDSMSRMVSERHSSTGTTSYSYNTEGELISVTALGETLTYGYDERGLLSSFTTPSGTHKYAYDALGRRVSHTLPNGSVNRFTYDAASQLITQDFSESSGDILSYTYDAVGQVSDISSVLNTDWSYQYDAINRLVSASHDQQYFYEYDALGNRIENGGVYDLFNKLLENNDYTFNYDEAGNLVSKVSKLSGQQHRYTFNNFGRLSDVEIAASVGANADYAASYAYDYTGRRVSKRVGRDTSYYQWKGFDLVGEYAGRSVAKTYRYADGYAATEFGAINGDFYVQGNILDTALTLTDAVNSLAWSQESSPYGVFNVTDADSIEFEQRFPNQYHDDVTGLQYNYFRYYDPEVGRYINSDPIGISGGINQYSYALQNPVNNADPFGLKSMSSTGSSGSSGGLIITIPSTRYPAPVKFENMNMGIRHSQMSAAASALERISKGPKLPPQLIELQLRLDYAAMEQSGKRRSEAQDTWRRNRGCISPENDPFYPHGPYPDQACAPNSTCIAPGDAYNQRRFYEMFPSLFGGY